MSRELLVIACCINVLTFDRAAGAACTAQIWQRYHNVDIWRFPDSATYFYKTNAMDVDADGAPTAYHPGDTGIDALSSASYPDGDWKSILVIDPSNSSKPYIQKSGEFAGYFLSATSLQDHTASVRVWSRYLDALTVPYLVFPGDFIASAHGKFGSIGAAINLSNGLHSSFVVGDQGPSHAALGEVSIRLIENLGGSHVNPRDGAGEPKGPFGYVIFPAPADAIAWPFTADQLSQRVERQLTKTGGWERIKECLK